MERIAVRRIGNKIGSAGPDARIDGDAGATAALDAVGLQSVQDGSGTAEAVVPVKPDIRGAADGQVEHQGFARFPNAGGGGVADVFRHRRSTALPLRNFQVQKSRKLLRNQATTVSGLTMMSGFLQPGRSLDKQDQKNRSTGHRCGRLGRLW